MPGIIVGADGSDHSLVVGSRGGGGFARLLIGPVRSQITHHAECPVVVIPGTRQAAQSKIKPKA